MTSSTAPSLPTRQTATGMWLAASAGRLAYFAHRVAGHAVTWRTSPRDLPLCSGDIVCDHCGQVLWCRAHDPWRPLATEMPADHWGATRPRRPWPTLFESLQHVLRLAEACPPGGSGDELRRAACELIEADSSHEVRFRQRRMLRAIARVERRQSRNRNREDDPSLSLLRQLTDALRDAHRPGLQER